MRKVFLTGATGFIGYHLLRELRYRGVEVFALCRPLSEQSLLMEKIDGVHVVYGELKHINKLPSVCAERDFDAFYHLAWEGASGQLRTEYAAQIDNIKWTCQAMDAAKSLNCKKFIVSGTVCENQCDAIIHENQFISAAYYLQAKKCTYEMVRSQSKRSNIPLVWCQFYHPIGVFNKKEQLIANTVLKLLQEESMEFGLAQALFDAVSVKDLAAGFYLAGECELSSDRCFIGSGAPRKLMEYLEELRMLINPKVSFQYGMRNDSQLPMKEEWLDISEFQKETGYFPQYDFKGTILEMKDWMERETDYNNKKWIF